MSESDAIPRGLEILLKKASVDPVFRALLLDRRAEAAGTIGLTLAPGEVLMLQSAPAEQLESIIARTTVPQEHRRAFLGQAAAAMLAALGVAGLAPGCDDLPVSDGIRPSKPPESRPEPLAPEKIEQQVKEVIARRFQIDRQKVTRETSLVHDLKATDIQLLGLKRQLEKDYAVKLPGADFFDRIKTVGDLVKAVQTAVKDRPELKPVEEDPGHPTNGIRPDRPVSKGIRPD